MHVGEGIGSASALDCAGLSLAIGAYLGAMHGARICESEGLPVNFYGQLAAGLVPVMESAITDLTNRVAADRHTDSQAALQTYSHAAQRILDQARDRSIDTSFPDFATGLLGRAEAAGLGDKDLSALIELLRRTDRTPEKT